MTYKKNRTYYTDDHKVINAPSVTEIIHGKSKGDNFETPAMRLGTKVHEELVERFMHQTIMSYNEKTQNIAIHVNHALQDIRNNLGGNFSDRFYNFELSFHCEEYNYVGTCDAIVEVKDELFVLEFKTGKRHEWHKEQLNAYMYGLNIHCGYIIYEDGFVKVNYDAKLFEQFTGRMHKTTEEEDAILNEIAANKEEQNILKNRINELEEANKTIIDKLDNKNIENDVIKITEYTRTSSTFSKEFKEEYKDKMIKKESKLIKVTLK